MSPNGDSCELWCGVQSKTIAVTVAADALGIAPDKIKYHDMLLGGGFGRRGHRDEEFVVESVLLSKATKRPVKLLWTREDDVRNGRFRPIYVQRIEWLASRAEGYTIVDWVEKSAAPARIEASARQGTMYFPGRTRPLCAYPQVAKYRGTGSIDDAGSFACAAP